MRRILSALPWVAALVLSASAAGNKTVTVWVPSEIKVDPATARLSTIAKGGGTAKFSKACAKAPGKFDTYTATLFDTGAGATYVIEIATDKLPEKGIAVDLSSLRAEGECTEGSRKWSKFSAVVSEPVNKEKKKNK